MFQCGICEKFCPNLKSNSHIIPKWMFKDCKNSKNATLAIDGLNSKVALLQDGPKYDVICSSCEDVTSKLDHFASLVFPTSSSDLSKFPTVTKEYDGRLIIRSGIDAEQLWRFVVSVILRGHSSGDCEISSQKHLSILKKAFLSAVPLDESLFHQYPVALYDYENPGIVIMPHKGYIEGHHYYQFFGAALAFRLWVSSHRKAECISDFCLKPRKPVLSLKLNLNEIGDIRESKVLLIEIANKLEFRAKIERWKNKQICLNPAHGLNQSKRHEQNSLSGSSSVYCDED